MSAEPQYIAQAASLIADAVTCEFPIAESAAVAGEILNGMSTPWELSWPAERPVTDLPGTLNTQLATFRGYLTAPELARAVKLAEKYIAADRELARSVAKATR